MTKLDEVIETVLRAREDGPDALAAMALSFGATMALGTLRIHALRGQIVELRAAQTAADEMVATLRHERDAALAECKAARQSVDEAKADAARLRALVESAADTAEVWRLRESVAALRADRARAVAERDRAVQEREAFSLRLSAAERERDEARAERDASDERWATVCRECDVALAERDAVQALHAELVATRADFGHQRNITEDALRERDDARAALDLARESAREAREEIAGALALVDEARARVEAIAVERNAIVSELSQATDAMMQARAECDALRDRPTYEARTVAPTPEELAAHDAAGGGWLVSWDGERYRRATVFWSGFDPSEWANAGLVWIAFDADGLPCAWPVPSAEVSP